MNAWRCGDVIVERFVRAGKVWSATPLTVVDWDGERLAAWLAPGTRCRRLHGVVDGIVMPPERWITVDHVWFGAGNVVLVRRGDPYAVHLFWEDDGRFSGWYVNLQEPMRLRPDGFETLDHALDVWFEPGAEAVSKDDDHLRQCQELGIVTADEAAAIRAAAADVCSRRSQLFPTGYESFRPDPRWPVPVLAEDDGQRRARP